jgi:DNA polymerase I-like protein with 3'-5' exonuclease and polymerase domains
MYDTPIPHSPNNIYYVQNRTDAESAVSHLLRFDMLGYDTETYHIVDHKIKAFEPADGAKMRLAQFGTPEGDVFVFDLYRTGKEFLHKLFPNPFLCVIQNAKFEIKFLQHEMGIYRFGHIWDTMNAEKLIYKGRVTYADKVGYGLDDIAKRQLEVDLPKDEQKSDWWMPELSQSQLEYAARDAMIVLPIFQKQRDKLREQSQVRVAELEFAATPSLAWMENNGIYLNTDKWLEVSRATAVKLEDTKKQLWHRLKLQNTLFDDMPTIKLGSRPQVLMALQRAGIDIPLDKEGNLSLSDRNLKSIKHLDEIRLYLEYVKYAKSISSFGPNWVDKRNRFTQRIHCNINQIGAETGRLAASGPNLMQIKKDSHYRNAFEAREGWVFIDADYSQCELRILAEYCRDPNLLRAFDNKYDLHRFSAHLIFKCLMEAVTDIQRGIAKNLNFGIVYGIGVLKFAIDAGISIDEAQAIMDFYLKEAYPEMGHFLASRARAVLYDMYATTMTGRIRQYHGDLNNKEFKAQVQRLAKNLPIQGTNADITKRALALTYDELVLKGLVENVKMILPIHDEIILESHPAYAIQGKMILESNMLKAEREYLRRVPCVVDSHITKCWVKEPTQEQLDEAMTLVIGL